jgi:hypothetical protein
MAGLSALSLGQVLEDERGDRLRQVGLAEEDALAAGPHLPLDQGHGAVVEDDSPVLRLLADDVIRLTLKVDDRRRRLLTSLLRMTSGCPKSARKIGRSSAGQIQKFPDFVVERLDKRSGGYEAA